MVAKILLFVLIAHSMSLLYTNRVVQELLVNDRN